MNQDPSIQDQASILLFFAEPNPSRNNIPATSVSFINKDDQRVPLHEHGIANMISKSATQNDSFFTFEIKEGIFKIWTIDRV